MTKGLTIITTWCKKLSIFLGLFSDSKPDPGTHVKVMCFSNDAQMYIDMLKQSSHIEDKTNSKQNVCIKSERVSILLINCI